MRMEAVPLIDPLGVRHGASGVTQDITTEYHQTQQREILRAVAHACAGAADVATLAALVSFANARYHR